MTYIHMLTFLYELCALLYECYELQVLYTMTAATMYCLMSVYIIYNLALDYINPWHGKKKMRVSFSKPPNSILSNSLLHRNAPRRHERASHR